MEQNYRAATAEIPESAWQGLSDLIHSPLVWLSSLAEALRQASDLPSSTCHLANPPRKETGYSICLTLKPAWRLAWICWFFRFFMRLNVLVRCLMFRLFGGLTSEIESLSFRLRPCTLAPFLKVFWSLPPFPLRRSWSQISNRRLPYRLSSSPTQERVFMASLNSLRPLRPQPIPHMNLGSIYQNNRLWFTWVCTLFTLV